MKLLDVPVIDIAPFRLVVRPRNKQWPKRWTAHAATSDSW